MKQDVNLLMKKIKKIIEQTLLIDTTQLKADDNLELSLGIDRETNWPLLISNLEQIHELSAEAKSLLMQATNLKQLASIVMEEVELG